jgi:hypothetical protein
LNVTGSSQAFFPAPSQNSRSSNQSGGSAFPPAGTNDLASAPLSNIHVLSKISTTLPDGKTLSEMRFDLGGNGLQAQSGSAPDSGTPSLMDKMQDQQMFASMSQMAAYFGSSLTADNTTLQGTAALDIKL